MPETKYDLWSSLQHALGNAAVEIRGVAQVRCYLESHADMYELTEGLCKNARQQFGADALFTLQVYRDPEIEDESLALYVRLPSYGPDALPRIRSIADAFDNE